MTEILYKREQITYLINILIFFDQSKDRLLSLYDLKQTLSCLCYNIPCDEELEEFLSNDSHRLALFQFLRVMINDVVRKHFNETKSLDSPRKESIHDLNNMCGYLGEAFSDEEIDDLVDLSFDDEE